MTVCVRPYSFIIPIFNKIPVMMFNFVCVYMVTNLLNPPHFPDDKLGNNSRPIFRWIPYTFYFTAAKKYARNN